MPAADVKNKRTLSDSEMLAYSRNRYADRKLDTRMRQISLEAQSVRDRHYRETTQWHSFCRASAKTSGWSGVDDHLDEEDPVSSPLRSSLAGQGRGIRGYPVSRRSPHVRSVSATELARSSSFHNEALTRLQKPWAYTYSETSYNCVYNEAAQAARSQAATLFLRYVAFRSRSASDVSEGEDKGQPGARVTSSSHARRTSDGCRSSHSSSKGLPRVRFRDAVSSEKGLESRPRTSMLVTRGQETSLRPSTVHGCAKRSSDRDFFESSGISDIVLTQQETSTDQLLPLSREASHKTSFGNSSSGDLNTNSLDSEKTGAGEDYNGQEGNLTETIAKRDIPAHEHLESRASKNNYNAQDPDAQQQLTEDNESSDLPYPATNFNKTEDASIKDSPRELENGSQLHQHKTANDVSGAPQYPDILETSLNETPLMILAHKIKRQPRNRDGKDMENDPDTQSFIGESVPADVSCKREKELQEVNVDPIAQTSLGKSYLRKPSLITYTDSKAASPDGTNQTSDQTGLTSTSKLSSADFNKSREAESKKDIYVRARKTHHPETRPQEQRMQRLADKEKYPDIAVTSDGNTSTSSSDKDVLTTSSSFKPNKDMDTKLIKTESAEISPKQPEHRESARDSGGQSPATKHHQGSSHEAVAAAVADDDNDAVFPSPRSGQRTYITTRDSVDPDNNCTLFRGHKIFNYVRPQDRYKTDPFYTSRRERLLQRLSMETPVTVGGSRNHVKVAVVFPKHARQRLLQRLVEQNHRSSRTADRGAVHPVLRARIEQFYETLEPFCLSKRVLE